MLSMKSYKQVIVLRDDLEMSKGKMISQACHASLNSYKKASKSNISKWESKGAKKVILKSNNIQNLKQKAERKGISNSVVRDAGHTELESGTVTAIGIGPAEESELDEITGDLELVS